MTKTNAKSTKLTVKDDGTIAVPIRGEDGEPRELTLREPTISELATIHEAVSAADDTMPKLPKLGQPPGKDATTEERAAYLAELQEFEKISRERTVLMFGNDSPYGPVFVQIVSTLSGEDVTPDQLYGWAMNSKACRKVLDHFTAPLDGADDEMAQFAEMLAKVATDG